MERLRPRIKRNARNLRRTMTDAEHLLWQHLRNRSFHGYKFRRQYPAGIYILDFYCADLRLGIELDGGQHSLPEMQFYDVHRTRELSSLQIKIVRYWNNEVVNRTELVLEDLLSHMQARK